MERKSIYTSAITPAGNSSYSRTSQEEADNRAISLDAKGCMDCISCVACADCENCADCVNCADCTDCTGCVDCDNCVDCDDCRNIDQLEAASGIHKD